ncbi:aldo-keto reductase [Lineolata rhizophorae]|uniref:Aldo-keto reductase n=1 Tax=Lineolata rhizophorae TaxID=578093 RepID=A0A6A6P8L6_9PEZI|nr:aldo-keto reductase [Lineolata rhizophorae]
MAPKFPQRKLGDELVSAIGLGCMGMSIVLSSGTNDEESLKVLTEAADMGITFWDTSDYYGPFTNEELIGRWFKETGRRDEIFLATKFAHKIVDGRFEVHGEPDHVKDACAASLKRLQTDRIDLYYQHRVDPKTPIEKTVEAMAQLKKEGKIRYLGLSECSARTLQRAHNVHPIAAVQMEFSPFALEIESTQTNLLKTARELGVKIVAYSPLGRGFLTGNIKSRDDFDEMDRRKMFPRFSEENFAGNLRLVEALASIANEKGCTSGQLALAWVLAQGDDFIPIPGTKHVKYLKENAGALNVELSKEDDARIRKTIESVGGSKGARYPEPFLSHCFGDSPELGSN